MKNIKFTFYLLLLMWGVFFTFSFSQSQTQSGAKNIYVTAVEKTSPNEYSITLNDVIVIKEIKVKKTKIGQREIVNVEFPTYISKRGRAYPQVIIHDKEVNDKILKVLTTATAENVKEIPLPKFKLGKYSPYRQSSSSLKVFASVIFEDAVEIECKIMQGRYGPWVAWPSRKDETTNKWVKQVVFKSKEYQKKVEQEVLSKYKVGVVESGEE
ncbi:MAG: septation protein SpoVG family protein [Endomicrobia bacterium]|nr:septation protein SpoVG family protein [Endomicrobiia bacterium]